jgi:hypothetical protein
MNCFICEKSFKQLDNLEKHFEKHHPEGERLCNRCDRYKNVIEYNMVYQDICRKCINKKQCEKCKKYYKKKYINQHECTILKLKTERYCNQCKISKPLIEFYVSKYRCIKCLKEKEECDVCHKVILKINMNHHKVIHQETTIEKRKCNQCNIIKLLQEFYTGMYICKECISKKRKLFNNFFKNTDKQLYDLP